jgi:hypothetical protein
MVGLYASVLRPQGLWPTVAGRMDGLAELSGWYLPVVLWLVFVLLLGELVVRRSQGLAAFCFPKNRWAFRLVTMAGVTLLLHALFVLLECILFWVVAAAYPLDFGPIRFYEGLMLTWLADLPLMAVFVAGEALRQILYRQAMQDWQHTSLMRKQAPTMRDDDLR